MLWAPNLIADVTLLPTDEGGRRGPTPADWFGCVCVVDGAMHDCRIDLSATGPVAPGDQVRLPFRFLVPSAVLPRLAVGAAFDLWEMGTIGHAVVVRLCEDA